MLIKLRFFRARHRLSQC